MQKLNDMNEYNTIRVPIVIENCIEYRTYWKHMSTHVQQQSYACMFIYKQLYICIEVSIVIITMTILMVAGVAGCMYFKNVSIVMCLYFIISEI